MAIVYHDGVAGKICANPECGWKPWSEFAVARSGGVPVGDGYKVATTRLITFSLYVLDAIAKRTTKALIIAIGQVNFVKFGYL